MQINHPTFTVFKHAAYTILFCVALAGCASNKPEINISESQDFAALNTFYVTPPLNAINEVIENQVANAITRTLQSKGLTPSSEEDADIIVGFFPSTASKENGTRVNLGLGTGIFGRSGGLSLGSIFSLPVGEQVTQYQNLQIDMVHNNEFIYSAAGSAELESKDSISVQQKLEQLVEVLLATYPAKG